MTGYSLPQNFGVANPNTSKRVELPFKYALAYWVNGNPQMASFAGTDPVAYFGGWAIPLPSMEECLDEFKTGALKGGLYQASRTNKKGESRIDYSTRRLAIAPVGFRNGWKLSTPGQDGRFRTVRQKNYEKGFSQFLQMIAFVFSQDKDEKTGKMVYTPWGISMLSLKGWQCTYMLDALREFETATLPARTALRDKFSGNVPPYNAFIVNVGTFGKEIKLVEKGKGTQVSSITPVIAGIPDQIEVGDVERWYVGDEQAEMMGYYFSAANEWLTVYEKGTETFGGGDDDETSHNAAPQSAPAVVDDDTPF